VARFEGQATDPCTHEHSKRSDELVPEGIWLHVPARRSYPPCVSPNQLPFWPCHVRPLFPLLSDTLSLFGEGCRAATSWIARTRRARQAATEVACKSQLRHAGPGSCLDVKAGWQPHSHDCLYETGRGRGGMRLASRLAKPTEIYQCAALWTSPIVTARGVRSRWGARFESRGWSLLRTDRSGWRVACSDGR
jgi:hypothetical protein